MTVENPPTTSTHKATIRMPDSIVHKIDEWNEGMYVSRPDFVLTAVREFAFECIYAFNEEIKECDEGETDEEKYARLNVNATCSVGELTKIVGKEMRENGNTTQMMIYIPRGLKMMIDYIMDFIPILNSINTFARVATVYKLTNTVNEQETAIQVTDFINSFGKLNRSEFAQKVRTIRDKRSPRRTLTIFDDDDEVVEGSLDDNGIKEHGTENVDVDH